MAYATAAKVTKEYLLEAVCFGGYESGVSRRRASTIDGWAEVFILRG